MVGFLNQENFFSFLDIIDRQFKLTCWMCSLIRMREALVYNTPNDHVTRDIRDGVAKLGDLRFRVLDLAGLEAKASSGSVLGRTTTMTRNILERAQFALFMIDARDGLQPMDLDVGKWLRKHASGLMIIVVMNKAKLLDEITCSLASAVGEAYRLRFGDPITLSSKLDWEWQSYIVL